MVQKVEIDTIQRTMPQKPVNSHLGELYRESLEMLVNPIIGAARTLDFLRTQTLDGIICLDFAKIKPLIHLIKGNEVKEREVDFSGADLRDVSFVGAYFERCRFSQSTIFATVPKQYGKEDRRNQFGGAYFINCVFDMGINFSKMDLSRCRFENCTFYGTRFIRSILTGTIFLNCTLDGCDFGGAVLAMLEDPDDEEKVYKNRAIFKGSSVARTNFAAAIVDREELEKEAKRANLAIFELKEDVRTLNEIILPQTTMDEDKKETEHTNDCSQSKNKRRKGNNDSSTSAKLKERIKSGRHNKPPSIIGGIGMHSQTSTLGPPLDEVEGEDSLVSGLTELLNEELPFPSDIFADRTRDSGFKDKK